MRLGQQLKAEPCCITTVISSLFRSVQNRRICGLFHNRKLLREENKKKVKNWYVLGLPYFYYFKNIFHKS